MLLLKSWVGKMTAERRDRKVYESKCNAESIIRVHGGKNLPNSLTERRRGKVSKKTEKAREDEKGVVGGGVGGSFFRQNVVELRGSKI